MERKELVALLEMLKPALSDTNLVDVFTCYAFNQKTVRAYSGSIGIVASCGVGDHPFAVEGKTLLGLLQNSSAEEVEIAAKDELVIKAGRSVFKMPYFNEGEFIFEEPEGTWDATLKVEEIISSLESARATSSTDNALPALMGVTLNLDEKAAYSCNGDVITKAELTGSKGKGAFTAPNGFCDALIKIAGDLGTEGTLTINNEWICAKLAAGVTVYGRMMPNPDLDYEDAITSSLNGLDKLYPIPLGLNEAIARARVVADRESAKTTFDLKGGKLKLHTKTHLGVVEDEVSFRGHPDVQAGVHPSLVHRSLTICTKMAILENCTTYQNDDGTVMQVISNIGE